MTLDQTCSSIRTPRFRSCNIFLNGKLLYENKILPKTPVSIAGVFPYTRK